MDTTTDSDAKGAVHLQRFMVAYEYPVCFTERLFEPANPVLADVLARLEPKRRHRCLVFIDGGLLEARPTLPEEITGYARHHAERMALVGPRSPSRAERRSRTSCSSSSRCCVRCSSTASIAIPT